MKFSMLFLFLLSSWHTLYCQQSFYICNAENRETIPFATLLFTKSNQAFMGNEKGMVTLPNSAIQEPNVSVQHLTFETKTCLINEVKDTIFLSPQLYTIPEILIHDITPLQVLQKVINNINFNYPINKFYLEGSYRQTHKENNVYARFIEAQVLVANEGMRKNLNQVQEESFAIKHLRKSFNYEKNGDQHGDHLVDLFADDPIQYLQRSVLNLANFASYDWTLEYLNIGLCKIEFQNKAWSSLKNIKGYVLVNKTDFAIEFIHFTEVPNHQTLATNKSNWKLINSWYEASYKKHDQIYILDKSTKWYNHEIRNERNPSEVKYLVAEKFEWTTSTFSFEDSASIKFTKQSNLYALELPYDAADWSAYPIDPSIQVDLEKRHSLAHQFNSK